MKSPTTKSILRLCLLSGLLATPLLQTGCVAIAAGAAAGASTMAYIRGELTAKFDKPYANVVKATERALKKLQFTTISVNKDALNAVIIARTATDKRIEIRVTKTDEQSASAHVRVGIFGDEALSRTIIQHIEREL